MQRFQPDFIGIGAQRSGTTWLYQRLREHPAIHMPHQRKEVHYFDWYYDKGPAWYERFLTRDQYRNESVKVGEITPAYLFREESAERIAADCPGAHLFAILRHPVDRAYSQYGLTVRTEAYRGDFDRFLAEFPDAVARGRYAEQLARFQAFHEAGRLHVMIYERVMRDPATALANLFEFLGAPGLPGDPSSCVSAGTRVNESYVPRYGRAMASAKRLARWLRDRELDAVVENTKALGAARLFGRKGGLPRLNPERRQRLVEEFRDDIVFLERRFGLQTGWISDVDPGGLRRDRP